MEDEINLGSVWKIKEGDNYFRQLFGNKDKSFIVCEISQFYRVTDNGFSVDFKIGTIDSHITVCSNWIDNPQFYFLKRGFLDCMEKVSEKKW